MAGFRYKNIILDVGFKLILNPDAVVIVIAIV